MTDELDALKSALKGLPAANPTARADATRLAMENFDRLQGSTDPLRPNEDRPVKAGLYSEILQMLKLLTSRPLLTATTSAAALFAGLFVILPLLDPAQVAPPVAKTAAEEPVVAQDALAGQIAAAPAPAPKPTAPARAKVASQSAAPEMADATAPAGAVEMLEYEAAPLTRMAAAPLDDTATMPEPNTETFSNAPTNPVHITAEEPVSTFSIDVDTASYAIVRQSLNAGFLPDPAAVRVEEMVNYFPYAYPAPKGDQAFQPTVTVMPSPWNAGTRLVHIAIQGALPEVDARPPLNLVFLIDTSGSMDDSSKLPLLKQSLALMLPQLRPQDQVAIVAYAGAAGQVLPPTAAADRQTILAALDRLGAGGGTAGAEGIALAYQVAKGMAEPGEVSRVLLATDGDFNVGLSDPEALKTYIANQAKGGVYLSVLGFGRGNLDDATMQALAQNGNGQAAYIDTLSEARKVLVDQLTGALFPIADNVKIQVEWNPAEVAEYRLIGYETRALRREDFNNDAVDAGDIGAGTQVTAIYEITAPGSAALLNDPLRYSTTAAGTAGELGYLRLRSVAPGASESTLLETAIRPDMAAPTDDARFAVAIAGFGQLLSGATYLGDWGWDQAIELARGARGADDFGYRIEAVNLMRLAATLSK